MAQFAGVRASGSRAGGRYVYTIIFVINILNVHVVLILLVYIFSTVFFTRYREFIEQSVPINIRIASTL